MAGPVRCAGSSLRWPERSSTPQDHAPDDAFLDDWLHRSCEVVDRYEPQLFWFDWWIEEAPFAPYLREFAACYDNRASQWNRGVAINYKHRAFPDGAAVFDVERGQLDDLRDTFWQTDTSVSRNSWGYIDAHDYKPVTSILHDLVDIVSKHGALLLNIGPRADGTIPEAEITMLPHLGAWLAVNGQAIYGTRPWKVFGEGPTDVVGGSFNGTKRVGFSGSDIRFMTRGDTLYATVLGVPTNEITVIRSLRTHLALHRRPIREVTLVGAPRGTAPLAWERTGDALQITIPEPVRRSVGKIADEAFVLRIRG